MGDRELFAVVNDWRPCNKTFDKDNLVDISIHFNFETTMTDLAVYHQSINIKNKTNKIDHENVNRFSLIIWFAFWLIFNFFFNQHA